MSCATHLKRDTTFLSAGGLLTAEWETQKPELWMSIIFLCRGIILNVLCNCQKKVTHEEWLSKWGPRWLRLTEATHIVQDENLHVQGQHFFQWIVCQLLTHYLQLLSLAPTVFLFSFTQRQCLVVIATSSIHRRSELWLACLSPADVHDHLWLAGRLLAWIVYSGWQPQEALCSRPQPFILWPASELGFCGRLKGY